jgi:ketosteroid isomerase-like protein
MSDYAAIRQLVERYVDAVNQRDAEAWGACWAPDGTWDLGPDRQVQGRENFVPAWKAAMAGLPMAILTVHGGVFEGREGDTARARWYISEYLRGGDGVPRFVVGCYHDQYRLIDGDWHFVRRTYERLYNGAPDLSSPLPEG